MVIALGRNLPKLTAIMEDIFEDMVYMVLPLEREMPKLKTVMEDISEGMELAAMLITSEREISILTIIMDNILEDMDMAVTVKILENDLLKKKANEEYRGGNRLAGSIHYLGKKSTEADYYYSEYLGSYGYSGYDHYIEKYLFTTFHFKI